MEELAEVGLSVDDRCEACELPYPPGWGLRFRALLSDGKKSVGSCLRIFIQSLLASR
jgi:hypothetical protein